MEISLGSESCLHVDVPFLCSSVAKERAMNTCEAKGGRQCTIMNYRCTYPWFDVPADVIRALQDYPRVIGLSAFTVYHGNYCGWGPQNSEGLDPVDDVDRICQRHDECWERRGDWDCQCERQLVRDARALAANRTTNQTSSSIAAVIATTYPVVMLANGCSL